VPHQTLLFSATMPKEIEQLTAQYLNKPVKVKIGRVSVPTANVAQNLQRCGEGEKLELLVSMLQVGLGGGWRPRWCVVLLGVAKGSWFGAVAAHLPRCPVCCDCRTKRSRQPPAGRRCR
jgi:superfamily II DNA/RNA helicase